MLITMLKQIKNAWKYFFNYFRIKHLKFRGAKIGDNVFISKGAKIDNPQFLRIGDNVYIGNDFYANCLGGLTISHGTIISNHCTIMTWNHDYKDNNIRPYGFNDVLKPVKICEQVWIGINVNICPGVTIEQQSVIGMGTTVSKNVCSGEIYAGNRVISNREILTNNVFELLALRTVINPINYLAFSSKMRKYRKLNRISFQEIFDIYSKPDAFSMMYRYSIDNGYDFNIPLRCLTRKEKK